MRARQTTGEVRATTAMCGNKALTWRRTCSAPDGPYICAAAAVRAHAVVQHRAPHDARLYPLHGGAKCLVASEWLVQLAVLQHRMRAVQMTVSSRPQGLNTPSVRR